MITLPYLLLVSSLMARVDYHWNTPQSQFLLIQAVPNGPTEYIDLEGAVRAGKSTAPAHKLARYAIKYPGIHMAATRWTQDGLDAQVKPLWRDTANALGLKLVWHAGEEYDEVQPYGSRVYLRALKSSEDTNRFAKLAGLTLAILWIDQPEEADGKVVSAYIPARLSQPGFPHEAWFTPNPVGEDHWLGEWFPVDDETPLAPHHHYIHTSIYDNRRILGEPYIADMEAKYPPGSALRRRFVDGLRGLGVVGDPVYQGYFSRDWHVAKETIPFYSNWPLYEAWDFGWGHPAVLWTQYIKGQWRVLAEAMGSGALPDFADWAIEQRGARFPNAVRIESVCDPAGFAHDSQGHRDTAAEMLELKGILLAPHEIVKNYNHPAVEYNAIQRTTGLMRGTSSPGKPQYLIDPSCRTFIAGCEAGYIWSDKGYTGSLGSVKKVDKQRDTVYNHLQDCWLYTLLRWGSGAMTQEQVDKMQTKLAAQEERRRQHDVDITERRASLARRHAGLGRGGYN